MEKEEKTTVSSCSDDLKRLNDEDFQLIDTAFDLLDLERPAGEPVTHLELDKDEDKSECLVTSTDDITPQSVSKDEENVADSGENKHESDLSTKELKQDEVADSQGQASSVDKPTEEKKKRKKNVSLSEEPAEKKKKSPVPSRTPERGFSDVPIFDDSSLPKGWTRKVVQRKSGASAGKFDVYIFSPDGRKLRSRVEVQAYLDEKGIKNITGADFEFSKSTKKNGKTPGKTPALSAPKTPKPLSSKSVSPKNSIRKPKPAKLVTPKQKMPVKKAATTVKRGRPALNKAPIRLSFSARKRTPKPLSPPVATPSTSSFRKSLAGRSTSTRNTPIRSSRRGRVIIPKLRDSPSTEKLKRRLSDKAAVKSDAGPRKSGKHSLEEALSKKKRGAKKEDEKPKEAPAKSEKTPDKDNKKLRRPVGGKVVKKGRGRTAGLKTSKPGNLRAAKSLKLALKRVGRRPARYTDSPDEVIETPRKGRVRSEPSENKSKGDDNASPEPVKQAKPTSSGRRSRVPARFVELPESEKKTRGDSMFAKSPAKKEVKAPNKGKAVIKGKKAGTKMMTRGKRNAMAKRNIEKEKKALEQDVELLKNAPAPPVVAEEEKEEDDNEFVTIKTTNHFPESPLKETPIHIPSLDESLDDSIVIDKTDDTSPNPFKSRYLRKKGPNKAVEALKKVPAGFHEAVSQTVAKKKSRTPQPVKSASKSAKPPQKKFRPPSPIDLGLPSGMTMTSSGRMVKAPTRISPSPPPERRPKEESPKMPKPPPKREPSPPKQKKPKTPKPPKQKIRKTPKAKPMKTYDEPLPPPDLNDRKEYPNRTSRNPYLDYIMSSDHARSPSPEDFLFDALHSSDMRRPELDLRPDPHRRPAPVIKVPSKRKNDKNGANRFGKSHFPASESDSDDLFDPHKENRFRKMQAELDDSIDGLDMIELQLQVTGGRHDDLSKNPAVELLPKVDSPVSMELIDALRDHDYYFRPMRELHIPSSMMSEDSNSLPLA